MSPASWLFIRGIESIRVALADDWKLLVSGPGAKRWSYSFKSEEERFEFQASLEHRLRLQGWVLEAYDHDRRGGADRRGQRRGSRERRRTTDDIRH